MATLAENAAKVVAAHGAIKDALVAKGVAVPEGAKLSDMPALVESIEAATPNLSFWAAHRSCAGDLVVPIISIADTVRQTDVSYCFQSCSSLTSLTLPDGFGGAATDVRYCFYSCSKLTSLTLPDGFGGAATNAIWCFSSCSSLTSLTLPDGFGGAATNVSYCFRNCSSLTSLTLPDGFGGAATTASGCFQSCSSLTTLNRAPAFTISWGIDFSPLTHESLVNICNTLVDLTAFATPKTATLTLGSGNLEKLTDEEKAVATAKGWTLA